MNKILDKISFLAISNIKIKAVAGAIGGCIAVELGGWDQGLKTLFTFMIIDYVTGFLAAVVFKKSPKSSNGDFNSHAGFKGLIKKCLMLSMVYIAVNLEHVIGMESGYIRTGLIIGLSINELGSIGENFELMGVPFLPAINNAIQQLKDMTSKKE